MLWELQWGSKVDFLEELEENGTTVQALANRPDIDERLMWYMDAFNTLSSRRPTDTIEMPLLLSEIIACMHFYPVFDSDRFLKIMVKLDGEYLAYKGSIITTELESKRSGK